MTASAAAGWKGSPEYWEELARIYSQKFREKPGSYIFVPLADALFNLGKMSEAIETLKMGVALKPGSRAGKTLLAQLLYDNGDEAAARGLLEEIAAKWPDSTAAVFLLCKIYERDGLVAEALRLSTTLMDYFPGSRFVQKLVERHEKIIAAHGRPDADGAMAVAEAAIAEPVNVNSVQIVETPSESMYAPQEVIEVENGPPGGVIIDEAGGAEGEMEPGGAVEARRTKRKGHRTGGGKAPENQIPLFRLENMLSHIAAMKKTLTNKHD
ncbi:MAG: hypothetical protein HZB29_00055 [Nitrospinae bacterium]|nr:hypothetical protein [Nitrospinota bacterium]